jgi:phasin family protein
MTLLSGQLSAASSNYLTVPLNAQLNVFSALATQALDNASRITALNLSTSHDVIERSAQTARQLMGARDARDFVVLRSHAEEQVRSLFAYSRELFGIATSAQPFMIRSATQATPAALPSPATLAEPAAQVAQVMVDASRDSYETAKAAAERTIDEVVSAPAAVPTPAVTPAAAAAPEPAAPPAPDDGDATSPPPEAPSLKNAPTMVQAADPADTVDDAAITATSPKPTPIAKAAGNGASQAATGPTPVAAPVERRDPDAVSTPATPRRRKK